MLETTPGRPPDDLRLHEHLVLAVRRRRAARRLPRRGRRRRRLQHPRLRVPRRVRHRADGLGQRRLRRPDHARRGARGDRRAARGPRGAARQAPGQPPGRRPPRNTPKAPTAYGAEMEGDAPVRRRRPIEQAPTQPEADGTHDQHLLFKDIDEPGLRTLDVYRAPRRLRDGAQGARDVARRARRRARGLRPARPRRRRLLDGQEGLVPAQDDDGQVPRLQRRRVRARAPSRTAS